MFHRAYGQMYPNTWTEFNIPIFLLKSILYGEWNWGESYIFKLLYPISLLLNAILIFKIVVYIFSSLFIKTKRNKIWIIAFFLLFAFNIGSYIKLNLDLPYGCSMDFRYLLTTLVLSAIFICFAIQNKCRYSKDVSKVMYRNIFLLTLFLYLSSDTIILWPNN